MTQLPFNYLPIHIANTKKRKHRSSFRYAWNGPLITYLMAYLNRSTAIIKFQNVGFGATFRPRFFWPTLSHIAKLIIGNILNLRITNIGSFMNIHLTRKRIPLIVTGTTLAKKKLTVKRRLGDAETFGHRLAR